VAAKLVVTASKGGSRIALVGASGTELLTSRVFSEPRAKGATLRSLKGMLGEDIVVEDHTLAASRGHNGGTAKEAAKPARAKASRGRPPARAGGARARTASAQTKPASRTRS
jgi:hypothetical protein